MNGLIVHDCPLHIDFYAHPYNKLRRAKIILFGSSLSSYKEFRNLTYASKTLILKNIERACFNYTIDLSHEENIVNSWDDEIFCGIYHSICYKISVNLELGGLVNNPTLAKNIFNKVIDINNLPKMTSYDMYPQKYIKIKQRLEASRHANQTIKTSTMYKCRRCHESKCTIENVYNRCLDEGVNLRITCTVCGNEFNA